MMICGDKDGFRPVACYARKARKPLMGRLSDDPSSINLFNFSHFLGYARYKLVGEDRRKLDDRESKVSLDGPERF